MRPHSLCYSHILSERTMAIVSHKCTPIQPAYLQYLCTLIACSVFPSSLFISDHVPFFCCPSLSFACDGKASGPNMLIHFYQNGTIYVYAWLWLEFDGIYLKYVRHATIFDALSTKNIPIELADKCDAILIASFAAWQTLFPIPIELPLYWPTRFRKLLSIYDLWSNTAHTLQT